MKQRKVSRDNIPSRIFYIEPKRRAVWLPKQTKSPHKYFPGGISTNDDDENPEEYHQQNLDGPRFKSKFNQMVNYPTGGPPPRRTSLQTVAPSPFLSLRQTAEDISSQSGDEDTIWRRNTQLQSVVECQLTKVIVPPEGHILYHSLVNGFISVPNACVNAEEDITQTLQYTTKKEDVYFELRRRKSEIRAIIASHCGEEEYPGNTEEKLRTEATTHIWVSEKCPDIPLRKLYGFVF
ncbi:hypothetical protein MGYG_00744 [Nannizzia gypsea CBS 118893]|uniref:Uncharacterized protein n=1 Tax=Arthroderma gypseum (strain ATCC MYA-4604 / CBS 118893) TaxID=535722 RepID=E5R1F4_ARTGP|nr:hypothetical protein MGYG_00744 [Nannizzia gypsea CBS 118893]EFQ97705.1 hypothetical protein MGYG_00744 [Nannizzia gypsea CBS 118893]